MKIAPYHPDEQRRLQVLRDYAILDTAPEQALDELTQVAAIIAGTPIALISLVDEHRQWFKSRVGLDVSETPRELAFCAHAILNPTEVMLVQDASQDDRFADHPAVAGAPHVSFYAGVPLLASDANLPIGTLCVVDLKPRQLSPSQIEVLQKVARQVVRALDARLAGERLKASMEQITFNMSALRESERQLLEAQEVARLGHWGFDGATGKIWWSKMVYEIFDRPEKMGPPSFDEYKSMIHPEDLGNVLATVEGCLGQGIDYSIEHKLVLRNGEIRVVRARGRTRREGERQTGLLAGTVQDVTAEALVRAELIRAKDMAEAATQAKSSFLATMSHEIRTPLNGVIGGVDLLLTSELDVNQRVWAKAARSSGRALLVLLNDILDLSKLEAEKVVLENISFHPTDLVADVMEILGESARAKGISLVAKPDPTAATSLLGDPNRLRQVLLNLVNNAIKFTERGSVEIQVSCVATTDRRNDLAIVVKDTGIGISNESLAELFRPFSQADSSTTRRFGGTGLGLAICKRIVDLMDGEIKVFSEPGQGTSFTVSMKLCPGTSSVARRSDPRSSDSPSLLTLGALAKRRILLVEDNAINRMIVTTYLKKLGVAVDVAVDGEQALAAHHKQPYDLILMDCQMPLMDGFEACRRVRAAEISDHRIPIVALTANAFQGDREACLKAGMDDYLSKPVSGDDLRQTIIRWLLP